MTNAQCRGDATYHLRLALTVRYGTCKGCVSYLHELQEEQGYDAEEYHGKGIVITASALQHGLKFYNLAMRMYGNADNNTSWTDLLGLLAPVEAIEQLKEDVLADDITSIQQLEDRFCDIFESYKQWKGFADNDVEVERAHAEWQSAIRKDAEREFDLGDVSEELLLDFLKTL